MAKSSPPIKSAPRKTGGLFFVFVLLSSFVLWGVVLPRMAEWETVRNRADLFSEAGIHPAAIYYSDHPSMNEIESRVARKLNR
ncbi:MAG: hypothetical protein MUC83_02740 [Pirellula sp.]|nr:hypothetical protein [Pirellula sp.]